MRQNDTLKSQILVKSYFIFHTHILLRNMEKEKYEKMLRINNRNTKPSVGVRFGQVKVTKRKSPVRKVARKGKLRPRVVSKAVPKKKVGTGKPIVPAKKPINGSKASRTANNEKEGKAEEEKKQVEKVEKKTTDCCCSEKDGEEVQSCWMCRLSQRLGGKLIGNKIKTK